MQLLVFSHGAKSLVSFFGRRKRRKDCSKIMALVDLALPGVLREENGPFSAHWLLLVTSTQRYCKPIVDFQFLRMMEPFLVLRSLIYLR